MIPILYNPEEKEYKSDGLGLLSKTTFCHVTESANSSFELELHYPTGSKYDDYFTNEYQILAKPNDIDEPHAFKIYNKVMDEFTNEVIIYAHSRTYKLGNRGVKEVIIENQNGYDAMKAIEKAMDQKSDIELFSDIATQSSTTFERRNVLNCIAGEQGSIFQYWGGEIKRENHRLSLLKRRGRDNVTEISYRKNLVGLKVVTKWEGMVTKIIPYAELQQENDGKTDIIYGSPVSSNLMDTYPDVYFKYIQFTEEQGVTDLASLNKVAAKYFTSLNPGIDKPSISIEANIEDLASTENGEKFKSLRKLGLFDTFQLEHEVWGINFETKVNSIEYDVLLEKVHSIKAGVAQKPFYESQSSQLNETIKTLTKKGYMSEFVDYVTDLINGVDGGSVLQYPKNRPHSTYWMDTDSIETAQEVMVHNYKGIGFSKNGWRGPFDYGWTIDGILNASFIKAGTLNGVEIIAENDKFKIVLYDGKIQFFNAKNGDYLGMLFATFGGNGDVNGVAFEQEPGYIFSLNSGDKATGKSAPVVQIPADSTRENRKLNLFGEVRLKGDFYVNDVKIDTNGGGTGGGGGWNGLYPPELTQAFEKYAWQLYQILISMGYSREAACGILGNVQEEVGPSMNPDTEQVGGPAYGCVQWDGSAYPLVGQPTWNGREYVQRLMDAAKILDDYTTYKAQGPLIDWCMYNGQWIGQVYPTSVNAFKRLADPRTAAHAFEMNFERPKDAHPIRQEYAQRWFDKFKDLKQPTNGKYIKPMTQYTITSEFGWRPSPFPPYQPELHNGIDLANGGGSQIFASQEGEVVQAGPEHFSWFGNYVVIKHPDGLYTGYAHLSQINVKVGQKVTQGQLIGLEGDTGPVTGPHLHFQVMKSYSNGWPVGGESDFMNPREFVNF